jgi:hypothetical protein
VWRWRHVPSRRRKNMSGVSLDSAEHHHAARG